MLNAPFSRNGITLIRLTELVNQNSIVFGGKIPENVKNMFSAKGAEVIDYLEREELSVLNAVPTAEGAVSLALEEMPVTVYGSHILITGFGRISKILARILAAMGADVTIAARKYSDRAWAQVSGYKTCDFSGIENTPEIYDVVYNTVPAPVLGKRFIEKVKHDCLMIDLASRPGGIDFSAAAELGIKVIWALGLPGKCAPVTSGHIIAATIENILSERGRL
jgi:dipicolinate synthase subunit A